MVEILVAVLVLSIGVLGYAGLQLRALNSTSEAYMRTQATALGEDMVERIMANPAGMSTYTTASNWSVSDGSGSMPQTCVDPASPCTSAQVASWDINQTSWQAANLLPAGKVNASACVGSQATCVRVAWNDTTLAQCEDADSVVSGVDCVVLEVVR